MSIIPSKKLRGPGGKRGRVRLFLSLCVVACGIPRPAGAADRPDAAKILKGADAAAKALSTVRYEVDFECSPAERCPLVKLSGSFLVSGWVAGRPERFLIDAMVTESRSSDPEHLTAGCDGEFYYLIRHAEKKVYEDIDPAVLGSAQPLLLRFGAVVEFGHPTPFSDELKAKTQELLGTSKVAGEDCYEVKVAYRNVPLESTWSFSQRDLLPRRRVDVINWSGSRQRRQRTIKRIDIAPKVTSEDFKLRMPKGYSKTDEFAP